MSRLRQGEKRLLWVGGISVLAAGLCPLPIPRYVVETYQSDGKSWSMCIDRWTGNTTELTGQADDLRWRWDSPPPQEAP